MNIFLKRIEIPAVVFITGACVLIIEIVAIRILSPYFGNTIFTVSSVISVVLAALSAGYYLGGKLADNRPEEALFYHIITGSGVAVIILYLIGVVFLSRYGYEFSIIEGPVISSIILFFPQSFLLGLLSPFAVKLQKLRVEELGIGTVSGQIFFWSTLGSIMGSLVAGFVLIPNFGIDKIMLGIGFLLLALGFFGGLAVTLWQKLILIVTVLGASLVSISYFSLSYENMIYHTDSLYQKIVIYDGLHNNRPARFLMQDKSPSAAMFIDSNELAYEYTKYYAIYQLLNPAAKNMLAIGGGAYSVPKALLGDSPEIIVDVAEIDPLLFDLGKKYFKVEDSSADKAGSSVDEARSPRLKNFTQDGRRFLRDANKNYDVIFSDAYSSFFSTPEHLTTKEFFELAKQKLSNSGVFIANVVGSLPAGKEGLPADNQTSFVLSEIKTFQSVFDNSYIFAVTSPNLTTSQNFIFIGYNSNKKVDFSSPEIIKNKNPILSGLAGKLIDASKIDLSKQILLTDNYAPVDYLISKEFKNLD
jgi:spermidine synthase